MVSPDGPASCRGAVASWPVRCLARRAPVCGGPDRPGIGGVPAITFPARQTAVLTVTPESLSEVTHLGNR
jgi:hypothetical protein